MKRLILLPLILVLLAGCSLLREQPDVYLVFFPSSEITLSPGARAVVDKAAAAIRMRHPDSVMIAAGTATGDNLKLAQPRFLAVREALIADGIADDLIARSAIADPSLSIGATGDQRVEIRLVNKVQP